MAYRADALALPATGRASRSGTEIHTEELICSWARARGWRILYDPEIPVDHHVLADESAGARPDPSAMRGLRRGFDRAHNRMLGTIATDPDRAAVHVAYGLLVGCREAPGLARAAIAIARNEGVRDRTSGPVTGGQSAAPAALAGSRPRWNPAPRCASEPDPRPVLVISRAALVVPTIPSWRRLPATPASSSPSSSRRAGGSPGGSRNSSRAPPPVTSSSPSVR